jgi:hypothetical protein
MTNRPRTWREAEEHEKYHLIKSRLEDIVKQGKDELEFHVEVDTKGLQQVSGWGKSHYWQPNETPEEYFARVFISYDLYYNEDKNELVANEQNLSLYFDVREEIETSREKVRIFQPAYSALAPIDVEMDVKKRKKILHLRDYDENAVPLEWINYIENVFINGKDLYEVSRGYRKRIRNRQFYTFVGIPALIMAGFFSLIGYVLYSTQNNRNDAKAFAAPTAYTIETHDVDQVFRDHNAYRTYHDNEDGKVIEKIYFDQGNKRNSHYSVPLPKLSLEDFKELGIEGKPIRVFKDLEPGEQGYANVMHYTLNSGAECGCWLDEDDPLYYVEIHLPKDQGLEPGNETYGGKSQTHSQMSEIK